MDYKTVLENEEYQNVNVFQVEEGEDENYRLNRYHYAPEGNGAIVMETIQNIEAFLSQATPESFYEMFEQHRDEVTTTYEFGADTEHNEDLLDWFVNAATDGYRDDSEFITYALDENSRQVLEEALDNLRNTVAMYKALREMTLDKYEGTIEVTTLGPDGEPTGVSQMECYVGKSIVNGEEAVIHIGRAENGELYVSVNDNDFEPIKQPMYQEMNTSLDTVLQEVPTIKESSITIDRA